MHTGYLLGYLSSYDESIRIIHRKSFLGTLKTANRKPILLAGALGFYAMIGSMMIVDNDAQADFNIWLYIAAPLGVAILLSFLAILVSFLFGDDYLVIKPNENGYKKIKQWKDCFGDFTFEEMFLNWVELSGTLKAKKSSLKKLQKMSGPVQDYIDTLKEEIRSLRSDKLQLEDDLDVEAARILINC